jgi:hypothetical protein
MPSQLSPGTFEIHYIHSEPDTPENQVMDFGFLTVDMAGLASDSGSFIP